MNCQVDNSVVASKVCACGRLQQLACGVQEKSSQKINIDMEHPLFVDHFPVKPGLSLCCWREN